MHITINYPLTREKSMKFETNDLVAINFYDHRGDSTKKRAIGKVIMGTNTTPPQDYCRVELIYPSTCKGTSIGVLVKDLRHLNAKLPGQQGSIAWEEIVLGLARELDDGQQQSKMAPEPAPPASQTEVTTKPKPEEPKPSADLGPTSPLQEAPSTTARDSQDDSAYTIGNPFTVILGSGAIGKFCQNCTEKIKVGERVQERKRRGLIPVNADPSQKFYEHASGCVYEGGERGFGQGTGGGNRVIRSSKNLGG